MATDLSSNEFMVGEDATPFTLEEKASGHGRGAAAGDVGKGM
jgi:hypothetical protein